jgi:hypothetical protein
MHDALYAYLIYIPADFVARLITNQPTQLSSRLYGHLGYQIKLKSSSFLLKLYLLLFICLQMLQFTYIRIS